MPKMADAYYLKPMAMAGHVVNPIQSDITLASRRELIAECDRRALALTGKTQVLKVYFDIYSLSRISAKVLKRRFGFISMLGLTSTLMATWEGILAFFISGLTNGGPAGLVYSFLITWVGVLAVIMCLAELASMAPTAGGAYYWVFILAPKSYRKFLSYITGWLSVAVWQGFVANSGYLCGTFIQGLIILNYPDTYDPRGWHGTLLFWATMFVTMFTNTILARWLPKIEGFILFLHVLGFFAILVPLVYLADHASAADVFAQFRNSGGYSTQGLSFLVGMTTSVAALIGADCAVHMSEEIHNASRILPWNMIITVLVNGLLGFGMLIAALFCVGDVQAALDSPTGYPFIEVFFEATQSPAGTTVMVCIPLVLSFCAIVGQYATASRQMWSFARDRGLPFWPQLSSVNTHSTLPMWSIVVTCIISLMIALINIGSTAALINIISFITSSWLAAAFVPLALLFWRRTSGGIKPHVAVEYNSSYAYQPENIRWGSWRMPEPYGTIINGMGLVWIIVVFVFSNFPISVPATAENMNYNCLMTGFWIFFSIFYYAIWGRKIYAGPVIEQKAVEGF